MHAMRREPGVENGIPGDSGAETPELRDNYGTSHFGVESDIPGDSGVETPELCDNYGTSHFPSGVKSYFVIMQRNDM